MSSSANHRNHNGRRRNPNSTSADRNRERAANKARREERLVNTNESRNRIFYLVVLGLEEESIRHVTCTIQFISEYKDQKHRQISVLLKLLPVIMNLPML